ncbi:hypothetical protein M426DRAFT_23703 [Hypoxylon sp. CI-4A]|nr:hypothetical protein M426DRAFT_23703 [Hypoxylon sp. CI-4A]
MMNLAADNQEVLVGNLDPVEHGSVPRLKLTDFGLATSVKQNKGNQYYLEKRRYAKEGYFAPEQFGVDWEHVHATTERGWELSESLVAGNYSYATNVWGIALVLWQCITLFRTPRPPEPQPGSPVTYAALIMDAEQYERVDLDLRQTIAECMRHDPGERPSLQQLLQQAQQGVTRTFPGESDAEIQSWISKYFLDPYQKPAGWNSNDDDDGDDEEDNGPKRGRKRRKDSSGSGGGGSDADRMDWTPTAKPALSKDSTEKPPEEL